LDWRREVRDILDGIEIVVRDSSGVGGDGVRDSEGYGPGRGIWQAR
jgi:hypothetical protein